VADDLWCGHVEEQRAGGAPTTVLEYLDGESGEGPTGAQLGELEAEGPGGIGGPKEQHRGGYHPAFGRVASGRHDGLTEHLAPLHDRAAAVGVGGADKAELAVGAHVEQVDQVRRVTPGGESLGVAAGRVAVDHLDPRPVGVEPAVVLQRLEIGARGRDDRQHRFFACGLGVPSLGLTFGLARRPAGEPEERQVDVAAGEIQQ